MKDTKTIMGMPITIEIVGKHVTKKIFERVFKYFEYVDQKFSTYKHNSEISRLNRDELELEYASQDMKAIFKLAEKTKQESKGYFDIRHNGKWDPSGIVKGWAIQNATNIIIAHGFDNFCLDVGGDIQVSGTNELNQPWRVGIRHPFDLGSMAKIIKVSNQGVATSGTYLQGQHIYNPHHNNPLTDIISLTVIGPNIYDADRFATAAFAMGKTGIEFIESLPGFEGYQIDINGVAIKTSQFGNFEVHQ